MSQQLTNACKGKDEMKAAISVFGLGYVGTVTAACMASRGHQVVGVDVQTPKVRSLAAGRSPIVEPEVECLLQQAHTRGQLTATDNSADAIL